MSEQAGPRFITVDLLVWSKEDLADFARVLEGKALVLYAGEMNGRFLVSLEVNGRSPEETIWKFLELIGRLRGRAKTLWRAAQERVFDIGFESGERIALLYPTRSGALMQKGRAKLAPCENTLTPDILRAVADVGGAVKMTIYPPMKRSPVRRRPRD